MSSTHSPTHTDRDHRVRVQFHWQRGSRAASRLAHPDASDNAPASAQLGTWLGRGMENSRKISLRLGNGKAKHIPTGVKHFGRAGRAAGLLGAAITSYWDWEKGGQELKKGNGIGYAYRTISILGGTGAILLLVPLAWASGVGIILIVFAIAVSILIEIFKSNPLQEWLENCLFGKALHPSPEVELNALRAIGDA